MITPATYASRYLPLQVQNGTGAVPVRISRYHMGAPTTAQQRLWAGLGEHLKTQQKADPGYAISLTVNGVVVQVRDAEQIRLPAVRPFYGKGSPEDCQIVLQLALLLGLSSADRLQGWANDNVGVDCNGFVGNYLFHVCMRQPWSANAGKDDPGPSQTIDKLFKWVAGADESSAVTDVDDVDPTRTYLVVRADGAGRVIPGPNPVGHVALTEPGKSMGSFTSMDLTRGNDGMFGNLALRTVESTGPTIGISENWMVFVRTLRPRALFQVNRDHIRKADPVKLAPIPKS